MNKTVTRFISVLLITAFVTASLSSCARQSASEHEPITIVTAGRDYTEFETELKKVYPEVNLKFISYKGKNPVHYLNKLLEAGQAPDIFTSGLLPDPQSQKEHLIDLSGYEFTAEYSASRLSECSVEGAIYMIPYDYSVLGITYNKTLFEKHSWSVPTSFEELKELVPKIKEANVELCATSLEAASSGFQYLFSLGDTGFLRTLDGLEWVEKFLCGDAVADSIWDETISYMQEWIDLGIINGKWYGRTASQVQSQFIKGNTAFYISNKPFRLTQYEDGTGDRYGIMPWLSVDGSNNRYITNAGGYIGINSELEKIENKQKLEDAIKVLTYASTDEGQRHLPIYSSSSGYDYRNNEHTVSELERIHAVLDEGYSAPITYNGWENVIIPIGNECLKWCAGISTGEKVISVMNSAVSDSLNDRLHFHAEVTEDLTTEETAKLVGTAFAKSAGADCALISLGDYHDGKENEFGVNGHLFDSYITDDDISMINPYGWVETIKTFELSGKEIKKLAADGFDLYSDGMPFPYVLTVSGDDNLSDDRIYTAVICGYTDEIQLKGKMKDTKIKGMDSIRDYLTDLGTVGKKNICG